MNNGGIWEAMPASPEHIPPIAADMREADRREVWASHRHSPAQALECSLSHSELAWTCLVDGSPAFMWGVGRYGGLISTTGRPWLLGTPAVARVSREFLRQCPDYVARMHELFPDLENYIHAENRLSLRWLKWLGFRIDEEPVFLNGEAFLRFWRTVYV